MLLGRLVLITYVKVIDSRNVNSMLPGGKTVKQTFTVGPSKGSKMGGSKYMGDYGS